MPTGQEHRRYGGSCFPRAAAERQTNNPVAVNRDKSCWDVRGCAWLWWQSKRHTSTDCQAKVKLRAAMSSRRAPDLGLRRGVYFGDHTHSQEANKIGGEAK
eukprot:scaffold114944_cov13-Tisochrysis_lutea.AAC.1